MKKRLLAMILAVVLAMSLLPMSVFAVDGGDQEGQEPVSANDGVSFTKTLESDKIKLEAYVDGEVKEENVPVDCDIVLVLDQSGSMVEGITDSEYVKAQMPEDGWTYNDVVGEEYYYLDNGAYRPVEGQTIDEFDGWCDDRNCTQKHEWWWGHKYHVKPVNYYLAYLAYGKDIVLGKMGTTADEVLYTGDLYKLVSTGNTTRLQAMKDAAQTFINAVQDAEGNHRVAVVGFACDYYNKNGYKDFGNGRFWNYDNTEVLSIAGTNSKVYQRVTAENIDTAQTYYIARDVEDQYSEISYIANAWRDNQWNSIDPNVTPFYEKVMNDGSQKTVGQKFSDTVDYANALVSKNDAILSDAIGALAARGATYGYLGLTMAKNIFDKAPAVEGSNDRQKVIVYITDGEDLNKESAKNVAATLAGTGYNAEIYSIFVGTLPTDESEKEAIVSFLQKDIASSEDNYANASNSEQLKKFIQEIATGSTTKTEIKANLTGNTVMTDVISDYFKVNGDIEVCTADKKAPDATDEWVDEQKVESGVTVAVEGKTVTVTGFDFAANCVTTTDKGGGDYGKKLIVYIPIAENDIGFGGYLPTNAYATLKDETTGKEFSTDSAYADCAVTAPDLKGTTVSGVSPYDLSSIASLFTYGDLPDGSNNAGVSMVYTLKQGTTVIATKTVPAGEAFDKAEWVWTEDHADKVDDMQAGTYTYTLDCQVTCIKDHDSAEVANSNTAISTVTVTEPAVKVTFDANGGTWTEGTTIAGYELNVARNQAAADKNPTDKVTAITSPTNGYKTFLGWGVKLDPDTGHASDTITLYPALGLGVNVSALQTVFGESPIVFYAMWNDPAPPVENLNYTIHQHYMGSDGQQVAQFNDELPKTAPSGTSIIPLFAGKDQNQTYEYQTYIYLDSKTEIRVGENTIPVTADTTLTADNTQIHLYYYLDAWKGGENPSETGGDGTADIYQVRVKYEAANEEGSVAPALEILTIPDGATSGTVDPAGSTASAAPNYAFDYWQENGTDVKTYDKVLNPAARTATGGSTITFTAYFGEDTKGDPTDPESKGDNIPDKYQKKVTFKVANGAWNNETTADVIKYVTLTNSEGKWAADGTYTVTAADVAAIPAAGEKPSTGYKAGSWDALYKESDVITADVTYTYTYAKKSDSTPSGGGGSSKPPVLNTEDHYGYIVGYPDGTVRPEGNITRAEVATIFFRMLTDESRTECWSQTNSYSDVSEGQWFNAAISTLSNAGIINGYSDGTFRPNGNITRAEFAAIASRFFEYAGADGENPFSDVSEDAWYYEYVMAASDMGLITGYPDGTFGPKKSITRAEAVTIVNRTLERAPDADHFLDDMITWPDNPESAWYYEAMQEATNSHEYQKKTASGSTYEVWTKILPVRDWVAYEKEWSDANSASGGEVVR